MQIGTTEITLIPVEFRTRKMVYVSIMRYMNTKPDDFYDCHRDRPDTTSFADLDRINVRRRPVRNPMPWGRIVMGAVIGLLLILAVNWVVRHYG